MNVQWYPGHMAKARRALKEKLSQVDMIIEVLDARAPRSTSNPDLEDLFEGRRKFYVLNKADLADPRITESWVSAIRKQGNACCSYSAVKGSADWLREQLRGEAEEILDRYEAKGMHKTLRALVAGVPNVGKSAILNRLVGKRKMTEANRPGVTRSLQWARVSPHFELMDSPGMLWPKFENDEVGAALALIGSIPSDILNEEELAMYLLDLLSKSEPELLMARYGIDCVQQPDPYEMLEALCRKRGFMMRGGQLDTDRGAVTLLQEFRNGKLGAVSLEIPSRPGSSAAAETDGRHD